jgi:dihydroorotate dehydrogenase
MMDTTEQTKDSSLTIREQLRLLLREFSRFGINPNVPELIGVPAERAEEIAHSRRRLVDLVQHDERTRNIDTLGESELQSLRLEIVRLCVEGSLQNLLSEIDVPYPIYNFFAGFDANAEGPWDKTPAADYAFLPSFGWQLMGIPVGFPIGVPASGLTANARWIRYFARQGFNILTYKTVRSDAYGAHRWPQWVFIEDLDPWKVLDDADRVSGDLAVWPKDLTDFSTANSFGMPSYVPKVWQRDVEQSLGQLEEGQLLIVSVVGSSEKYSGSALIEDFVRVAQLAEATGVKAIELNLSCPNTVSKTPEEGMGRLICSNATDSREIVEAVRGSLRTATKLVAKLGYLAADDLTAVVDAIAGAVDAISGINTVQTPIISPNTGETPFIGTAEDPNWPRKSAGVSGNAIRHLGLGFVGDLVQLRGARKFDIIGMGGVMSAEHVDEYLRAGATAVQTATGACLHPDIPAQVAAWSQLVGATSENSAIQPKGAAAKFLKVAEVLASGGYSLLSGRSNGRG